MMLLCCIPIISSATDYYVSSSGSDSSTGLSSSTPWKTISKVNSEFYNLNSGDRILFKRGDTFFGTLNIEGSGSSGNPITISAYGTGANPVISGFTTVSNWSEYGGGIYYKTISCESDPNIVSFNGVNTPMGKWPNSGYMTIDSHTSNTSIYDAALSSDPDWTGAEVVIRKNKYIWDRNTITDHSGSSIYYTSGSGYSADDEYGYFIQNSLETLDEPGEWYYDGSNFYMFFGSGSPSNYTVKVGCLDQLVYLDGNNYITLDNLSFEGANIYGIQIRNSDYVTIQNCSIEFTGRNAIYGPWWGSSPYCKINNNTIRNTNNNAIVLWGDHTYASVTNNKISNTGLLIGMGVSGDGTYIGISVAGDNGLIQYNTVENSGYVGISFAGDNTTVANNVVDGFNLVKNDGGGIYTYVGTGTWYTGLKVTDNIVLNGIGYGDATPGDDVIAAGIYLDDRSRNVTVTNNTVADCISAGIFLHNAHEINLSRNTLYNNGSGNDSYGCQMLLVHDTYSPDDPIENISMNNNIFFSRTASQYVMSFSTFEYDIPNFGSSDYNYYAKPINNTYIARTWSSGWYGSVTNRSLENWQSFTGQDYNSYLSPVSVTDPDRIRFEYNPSGSNKVISLDAGYIDVKGNRYSGSITLAPYSSVVLIVDPDTSTPVPDAPVYVSSAIENATPDMIDLTFSKTLSNTVPENSAFTVRVNSNTRRVNAVAVSGTKVTLTLSYAVVFGDVITVSYTKPSSNPLQTEAGGEAASMSAQTVTNRVSAASTATPTAPVYVSSAIENATPDRVEMTYNASLSGTVPSTSAFTVRVNSNTRAVNNVAVSGTKVYLTLSYAVVYGDAISVSYTKPVSNTLQTAAGGEAASLSVQTVANRVGAPAPVYSSAIIENASPARIDINYSLSLANIIPATSAFTVKVNNTNRTVSNVSISGTRVLLTLAIQAVYGDAITVAYTKPSSNPLQTTSGGQAVTFTAKTVTNKINPPVPVYVNSAIENSTPSRLEMTYNLALANIVPSISAFSVTVNNTAVTISSVAISGTKVILTLASPVTSGSTVKVSYTKPTSAPLQTAAGAQAATISSQTVTNKVGTVNVAPVVVVKYESKSYSGFVSEINAGQSYDTNSDNLTFSWSVPSNIPVSSATGSTIKYLGPIVDEAETVDFTVNVSDGKTTQSKTVSVEILPYQPGLDVAEIVNVEASSYQSPYYPYNIVDGNIGTLWSANGADQWVILELKDPISVQHVKVAFQPGQKKESYFDVLGSYDKETWEPVLTKQASCAFSGDLQVFDFPPSKTAKEFKYIKLVGQTNSVDTWNTVSEFRIFGYKHKYPTSYEELPVKIYPNPAHEFFNVRIEDSEFTHDFIRIITTTGVVMYDNKTDPDVSEFQVPVDLQKGIYIVQIGYGDITVFSQILVVAK